MEMESLKPPSRALPSLETGNGTSAGGLSRPTSRALPPLSQNKPPSVRYGAFLHLNIVKAWKQICCFQEEHSVAKFSIFFDCINLRFSLYSSLCVKIKFLSQVVFEILAK